MKKKIVLPVMMAALAMTASCGVLKTAEKSASSSPIPSMGEFARKAEKGAMMNVVFFGGSLTWGANATDPQRTSYRALVGERLRRKYPKTSFRFIDAAIGGTGSRLGIFRVERDVLQYKPDLVFLDFTLNDNMLGKEDIAYSSYESILRTILSRGKCPVVIVFTADRNNAKNGPSDKMFRRLNHFKLAACYQLPVADVVSGMNNLYKAGKINLDELWPADLFDSCHPSDKGYKVYADIIMDAYDKAVKDNVQPVMRNEWVNKPDFRYFARVKISDLGKLPKGWRVSMAEKVAGTFDFLTSRWVDNVVVAENGVRPGYDKYQYTGIVPEPLTVKFKGSSLALFGESTILCGRFKVTIDGKARRSYVDAAAFGNAFKSSAYLNCPLAEGLDPKKEHTLTITPVLSNKKFQQIRLESICVAGPESVYVKLK